jgi:hypothetical protein
MPTCIYNCIVSLFLQSESVNIQSGPWAGSNQNKHQSVTIYSISFFYLTERQHYQFGPHFHHDPFHPPFHWDKIFNIRTWPPIFYRVQTSPVQSTLPISKQDYASTIKPRPPILWRPLQSRQPQLERFLLSAQYYQSGPPLQLGRLYNQDN